MRNEFTSCGGAPHPGQAIGDTSSAGPRSPRWRAMGLALRRGGRSWGAEVYTSQFPSVIAEMAAHVDRSHQRPAASLRLAVGAGWAG